MEERIITLTKVFRDLNLLSHDSLFEFDGDEVIPRSDRVKLLFHHKLLERKDNFSLSGLLSNALEDPLDVSKQELVENMKKTLEEFPKSFVFLHNPTCYDGGYYKYSSDNALVKYSNNFGQDTRICIQQEDTKPPPRSRFFISTEGLGELITTLYFREKGYIIQSPRVSYGKDGDDRSGVDDVVAWKSSAVIRLREERLAEKGTHIGELACLRWLETVPSSGRSSERYITDDVILTEVESSPKGAIYRGKQSGVRQLLRAEKEKVAKHMFLCFPFFNRDPEHIIAELRREYEDGPVLGAILFGKEGLYVQSSESLPDEKMESEITKYEKHLVYALLNNFYFDEIMERIADTKNKGFRDVRQHFYGRLGEGEDVVESVIDFSVELNTLLFRKNEI